MDEIRAESVIRQKGLGLKHPDIRPCSSAHGYKLRAITRYNGSSDGRIAPERERVTESIAQGIEKCVTVTAQRSDGPPPSVRGTELINRRPHLARGLTRNVNTVQH